jgi:hypothetical protein
MKQLKPILLTIEALFQRHYNSPQYFLLFCRFTHRDTHTLIYIHPIIHTNIMKIDGLSTI